jgi:N-glycosylase/DNA lyase
MLSLKKDILAIPSEVKQLIDYRLREFASFSLKSEKEWFSELCYCLLTANAKAKTALSLQTDLGFEGFSSLSEKKLVTEIKNHKHRFHNVKASRIVLAREHLNIKSTITNLLKKENERQARLWLVENIKGLGLKEASHFLRNTGHNQVAIIDRHILSILKSYTLLQDSFELKNSKSYFQAEQVCEKLAQTINMTLAKLDLSLWYLKTGEVLK